MSLALDATLSTAQDSASRKPLVEIISAPAKSDIPLTGLDLSATAAVETGPFSLALSDNSTAAIHVSGTDIRFIYTDTAGIEFTPVMISLTGNPIFGLSACELTNGNVGITYFENDGGTYYLKRRIVTKLGVAVSNATIASWASSIFTTKTAVLTRGANDYLLVYAKKSGSDYYLYKRTSADFVTWSAESALTVGGLTATNKIDNPYIVKLLGSGEIWILFDYVESITGLFELRNVYLTKSTDSGASWSNATKLTDYTDYTTIGAYPALVQKGEDNAYLMFNKIQSLLKYTTGGFPISISHNSVNNTLIIVSGQPKITILDVATWAVVKYWDTGTVPALSGDTVLSPGFSNEFYQVVNGTNFIVMGGYEASNFYDVLNIEDDTITRYNFATVGSRTANMTWSGGNSGLWSGWSFQVDEANKKLWICSARESSLHAYVQVGWIDLTEAGPTYTFNVVLFTDNTFNWNNLDLRMLVVPENDYIILGGVGYSNRLNVYTISTAALYRAFSPATHSNFPTDGIRALCFYNEKVYAVFNYSAGQPGNKGLAEFDIPNDSIAYRTPSYASVDDYGFRRVLTAGATGKILVSTVQITGTTNGVSVFNTVDGSWSHYNSANVAGLAPDSFSIFQLLAYDPLNDYIFVSQVRSIGGSTEAVYMFPGVGSLKSSNYYSGVYSGGAWTWTDQGRLVKGNNEFNAVANPDPNNNNAAFFFWQTLGGDIKWGKDGSSIDVSGYLVCGKEVSTSHNIKNDPYSLTFSCSHGHLFDTHNIYSLLRDCFRKGRRIILRWGEKVAGVDYWQAAGTFYVTETQGPRYERGVYGDITITAEDMRTLWADSHIYATEHYNNYPEDIISDLLQTHAGLSAGDIDLPVFDNRILIEQQWIDTTLGEIINQLCWRFGYMPKITVDNKFSAVKISETAALSHVYTGNDTLISFEPDDKYSDFTNRVTVQGQEKTYINGTYPEEKVGVLNGTVGWYGCKKDFRVDYSEDGTRTCINPRLVVVESITSMGYFLADLTDITAGANFSLGDNELSESITYADPENKYCIVRVTAPDLTFSLLTAIGALIGTLYIPDKVISLGGGATIRLGSALTGLQSMVVMSILSAMGNYQLEIWATPAGRSRRSVQGTADDTVLQQEMGVVVENKFEDPLCYSVADCIFVANNELMVARLQRKRVKTRKLAHLQDEVGDTIQVKHPHTGTDMKLLITDLKRSYVKPTRDDDNGGFFDEIEGWVI